VTICILESGSSGNSFFISDGKTRLLIDAGLSRSNSMPLCGASAKTR
jgi:phosphoribosyl 1,2-cyclic phosphodiesterase